ncbi:MULTISPECIES: GHMP kinase [Brenneria]|uniref:GHMP kinase n=1 Tax=Brenneria nigrifluens DSM 30175 = ATCC 13028 TaxID=1121120 RepID=A0A2U1UX28_9GAMM|nr:MULTISPECIES: GHMP kinase [Brenneria]EHD22396.1 GHMP kinase [Brenneria sp. EniD312]PWC26217.1 GHMP kinase [Brenneria nigrifluens] [Brenneria nigrifluens DSM 30175 = ATCC 13028]QCR05402.1 GHMP kinase [Brenneria nigrifluens] [Brenneria nigrifluens DSM 30175 = ATCC 13028]
MAEARCPASCGELLQGWILGGEKLISCPVDWFSEVAVTDGAPGLTERPRMRRMLQAVLAHFGQPADGGRGLHIDFSSTIPVAKGMASSTADLAATALATARHIGQTLDEAALAALCVRLEPTDSTLFRQLTLFDHQTAATAISCDWQPRMDILLLESPLTLNTLDFHRRDRRQALLDNADALERAWRRFRRAVERREPHGLGEACVISAGASQRTLPKPAFGDLLDLVETSGIYGLNVAHSGSVVGLLLDGRYHDVDKLRWQLRQRGITRHYPVQHLLSMVAGGVR